MAQEILKDGKKIAIIGGGVAVLVIIVGYFCFGNTDKNQTASSIDASNLQGGRSGKEHADPQYQKLLSTWNSDNADAAQNQGSTFISTLAANNPTQVSYGNDRVAPQYQVQTPPQNNQQQQQLSQQEQQQAKIEDAFIKNVYNSRNISKGMSLATSFDNGTDKKGPFNDWVSSTFTPPESEQSQSGAKGQNSDSKMTKGARIISAYASIPVVADTAMDSDDSNAPAFFHSPSGTYQGAIFYSDQNRLAGDGIRVHISGMQWNGVQCKVDAYALQGDTQRASIASTTNDRWGRRILLPAIANGIGRTGELYEDSNSQMIITDGGSAYRSSSTPNGKAVAGTIVGGIGEQAGRVMAQDAARTPVKQALVDHNFAAIVRFVSPVYQSDCGDEAFSQSNSTTQKQNTAQTQQISAVQPEQQNPPTQSYGGPNDAYGSYEPRNNTRGYYR